MEARMGTRFTERPFQYVNFFDRISLADGQLTLPADIDTDPSFKESKVLGPMKASATAGIQNPNEGVFLDTDGVLKVVLESDTIAGFQSRTFYAVSPMIPTSALTTVAGSAGSQPPGQETFLPNHFNVAPNLYAVLDFDSPDSSARNPGDAGRVTWAVGLNFKSGNETDQGMGDKILIGPTCQFIENGNVRFNYTNATGPQLVYEGTYEEYAFNKTSFRLTLSMTRTLFNVEITASLLIDNIVRASVQIIPDATPPLDLLEIARPNSTHITAVGVALGFTGHSSDGTPVEGGTVVVRLRNFSLNYGQ
jgi:hypothetical protein